MYNFVKNQTAKSKTKQMETTKAVISRENKSFQENVIIAHKLSNEQYSHLSGRSGLWHKDNKCGAGPACEPRPHGSQKSVRG